MRGRNGVGLKAFLFLSLVCYIVYTDINLEEPSVKPLPAKVYILVSFIKYTILGY